MNDLRPVNVTTSPEEGKEKLSLPEQIGKWTLLLVAWLIGMSFLIGMLALAIRFLLWTFTASFVQ